MENTHSVEIENTPRQKITITTTGISKYELSCLKVPEHIIISHCLTPKTRFLVTYKAIFTDKYIQAIHWNIPIVSTGFLYDLDSNYKKYEIKPFQGAIFNTSGITDEIYANYLIQIGAKYETNCSIFIDFLVCDNTNSEKYKFCSKYNIPIVKTSQIFKSDFSIYLKNIKYDAKQLNSKTIFFEKTFYLDPGLPKALFNGLRRCIIENEGTRMSTLSSNVDFILSLQPDSYFQDFSDKIIYYQYVFDCKETTSVLYHEFYRINKTKLKPILPDLICVIDKNLPIEYSYKLKSLGATIKYNLDTRVTHFITNNSSTKSLEFPCSNNIPFQIVSSLWVDQCLTTLKYIKETKYQTGKLKLNKICPTKIEKDKLFQFTCLPSFFKDEMIMKFRKYEIKFDDSDKYNECTHLIMGSPNSSQKFFCSLVSGAWILRPDFVKDFDNQANFEYEKYEWTPSSGMTEKEQKVIRSIKKWRKRIQEGGHKPFYRWNVKIYCKDDKLENFRNLIITGGGEMNDIKNYTHVFLDKSYDGEVKDTITGNSNSIFSYLFK